MAAYDLEEQEQLSAIKAWWEKNGNIIGGIVLVLAVALGGYLPLVGFLGGVTATTAGLVPFPFIRIA